MANRVYTVAIAGAGKRGKVHGELFHRSPRFQVVGLADIDRQKLEEAAAICGSPELFDDAEEMLRATKPDVFGFFTPPAVRLSLIKPAVEVGVKLIAYEKPMALSMNEAIEIRDLLRKHNIMSVQSHQRKYNPQFVKTKEIIDSGALGRIHTVYGHATGWFTHMATHLVDYMRFLNNNAEAEWVVGQAVGREKLSDNHPSPDYAQGVIQFTNGVRGVLEVGNLAPDVPEVEYWWRKVRIGAQGTEGFAECFVGDGWRACTRSRGYESSEEGYWDAEHEQVPYIEDIALALDGVKEHPCDGEQGYKDLEIALAILRSAVERCQIMLPLGPGEPEIEAIVRVLPE